MTMLSYERSFSIFIKGSKIITQDYQKLFLKVSFFQLRPMRDYQRKIGFLKLILALYANSLRKTRKWLKIEKKKWLFKNKKWIPPFYNHFFCRKNRLIYFTTKRDFYENKNLIFFWKTRFSEKKVVYHANDFPTFRTTTIKYMDEQPEPFLMIS